MLLSSVIIAILIHLNRDNLNASMSMTTVIIVLIFVIFFQFGVGPIPPFITSELFVTAQRYLLDLRHSTWQGSAHDLLARREFGNLFSIFERKDFKNIISLRKYRKEIDLKKSLLANRKEMRFYEISSRLIEKRFSNNIIYLFSKSEKR